MVFEGGGGIRGLGELEDLDGDGAEFDAIAYVEGALLLLDAVDQGAVGGVLVGEDELAVLPVEEEMVAGDADVGEDHAGDASAIFCGGGHLIETATEGDGWGQRGLALLLGDRVDPAELNGLGFVRHRLCRRARRQ